MTSSSLFAAPTMSRDSRGIGEDAIDEPEPREEWHFENMEVVGEVTLSDEVEDRVLGADVSVKYIVGCSMLELLDRIMLGYE